MSISESETRNKWSGNSRRFRGLDARRNGAHDVEDAEDGADEEERGLSGESNWMWVVRRRSERLTTTREKTSNLSARSQWVSGTGKLSVDD